MRTSDWLLLALFAAFFATAPFWASFIGLGITELQTIATFALVAIGFNLLFGLTGYLSFGHAAFIGVGSYAAVWSMKLFTMDIIPAIIFASIVGGMFAYVIGFVALRRSGIYFSILTLAFAQMSFNLAYSTLSFITNGETGLQIKADDPRVIDQVFAADAEKIGQSSTFLGNLVSSNSVNGYIVCVVLATLGFYVAIRITRSSFGTMLRAIKSNQGRLGYTGISSRPYLITIFVISGMYAGLGGGLLVANDTLAGAERMQWTESGEIVLMTILGGVGTLFGPVLGALAIGWMEFQLPTINPSILKEFWGGVLPKDMVGPVVEISKWFVGKSWHFTVGIIFMLVVIFLPGGIMEGLRRIGSRFRGGKS